MKLVHPQYIHSLQGKINAFLPKSQHKKRFSEEKNKRGSVSAQPFPCFTTAPTTH
jgi:hypothetical protein